MSNKEKNIDDALEGLKLMNAFISNSGGMLESIFGGLRNTDTVEKYPYERLGNGYELRPIPLTKKQSETFIKLVENDLEANVSCKNCKINFKVFIIL